MENPELLNTKEAAKYLGVAPGTLQNWRCTKYQIIPVVCIGGSRRYRKSDLDTYIESRVRSAA
ncbi:helix-turn-helix domain-containing protein [bacterium]|nr:helix-turn-helix domain-containing protein [candidate division CSSED10-310 bacterium]